MTSSNLDLTSNTILPVVSIGYGNILDDSYIHKGVLPQSERLLGIATIFNQELVDKSTENYPRIAAWCEGSSAENLQTLAELTHLNPLHDPQQYSPREWMAVAADTSVQLSAPAEFIRYGKQREGFRPGILVLQFVGLTVCVVHHPHMILDARADRREGTNILRELAQDKKPTVLLSDLNVLSFQKARTDLIDNDYIEAHKSSRPTYPNEGFRGKTYPWLFPTIRLDAILATKNVRFGNTRTVASKYSDHPFLFTDIHAVNHNNSAQLNTNRLLRSY